MAGENGGRSEQPHALFPPLTGAHDGPGAGLGVEQLVGKYDATAAQLDRVADLHGSDGAKGVRDAGQDAAGGFRADLDEGVRAWIEGAQQVHARRRDQLAEDRAAGRGGEEIGAGRIAHARPGAAVVADRGIIEREFHEARKAHRAARVRVGAEDGEELRRGGGWYR
jgi:hypothetical protein